MTAGSAPNWFVALPVEASWLEERVPSVPSGTRRFGPGDLHLTVAFLGPVGEVRARAAFGAACWPVPPVDVTLGDVVPMGARARFSALSAVLEEGRAVVEHAIEHARPPIWTAAAAPADGRPAKAHVTIARPERGASMHERDEALRWASSLDLRGVRIRLDRIALYTWSEARTSGLFRIVDELRLEPS